MVHGTSIETMEKSIGKCILFRVDATAAIGAGHVMRCFALAQTCMQGGINSHFVTTEKTILFENRIISEGSNTTKLNVKSGSEDDALQTIDIAHKFGAQWIIIDGYNFHFNYLEVIKHSGLRLLYIDDLGGTSSYSADILLNQNPHASEIIYPNMESHVVLLLGTRYVLMRKEFLKWRTWERKIKRKVSKILVAMGGGNSDCNSLNILRALQSYRRSGSTEIIVISGAYHSAQGDLEDIANSSNGQIHLERNVNDMPKLMSWADIAISSGGVTCLENLFMGLPEIIIELAKNQSPTAKKLQELEVAVNLGWHQKVSSTQIHEALESLNTSVDKRRLMSLNGQKLIDGKGAERVLSVMAGFKEHAGDQGLFTLRKALPDDSLQIWRMANDPIVRKNSFHPNLIQTDEHIEWYKKKLKNENCVIWVMELEGAIVAEIRYESFGSNIAEIDFSVNSAFRGRGIGFRILKNTLNRACMDLNVRCLRGVVVKENIISQKIFLHADFHKLTDDIRSGRACSIYEWKIQ